MQVSHPHVPVDAGTGHVIVVHPWQDRYAHYTSYLDHSARPVTYVTTEVGQKGVPVEAAAVVVLGETTDQEALDSAVSDLVRKFGNPEGIVALKEADLPAVSRLRAQYGAPGARPEELSRFLDKYEMLQAVSALGLPLPKFSLAHSTNEVLAFAEDAGWPLITKKLSGSASQGVSQLDGPEDLHRVRLDGPMVLQEYRQHPIIHVDGFCSGDRLGPWRASRYIGTCLAFTTGDPLGSVEIDDPAILDVVGRFTEDLLTGLSSKPRVFHLELFLYQDRDGGWKCEFLEVGSRTGGAEVSFVWRDVHGIDLMGAETALQMGHVPSLRGFHQDEPVAGWLLAPVPMKRPCRVVEASSMVGPGQAYAEKVTSAGGVIPAGGSFYEHVGGRFRFSGSSSSEVEKAVRRTIEGFHLVCEPA
ncbi:hypothetical protein GCM10012275_10710 [Longimycelium tulufanense]|uniref:ATP-grasp domain-containing protein n=1 Tax=Longimycelium tulufanense TaxID=907463 RepID=A0A8J3CB42_9PSEU|nr:biotin carboxylase [Longimycelium tulufanense]GGM41596.1 hypothetical protein GCM10012275_10710 [Longimycelium tulufanense]